MTYVTVFGGNTVSPALLSYAGYTITATLNLVWSFEAVDGDSVAAAKLDITSNGAAVVLPPANQVSVGQDILIKNVGATTFEVFANDGTTSLGTIASGEAWYFYLTDNSDAAGVWESVQFGAGTSSADAAALAGKGLVANVTQLDQNLLTDNETTGLTIDLTRKARVVQNEGGTVVWAFDPAATLGDGFFFYAINAGTGTVTLAPDGSELIDGELTKLLQPSENCIIFCDGTSFHTVGYGRVLISEVTGASINVSGSGTQVLNTTQVDAQIQNFTGTLTGDRFVEYGNVVGYWFVRSEVTGAYTLTVRTNSLDSGAVIEPGIFTILRSDGTEMSIAYTDVGGTVASITGVPSQITLTPDPITTTGTVGLYAIGDGGGPYGSPTRTVTIEVDDFGRVLAGATDQLIEIPISQVLVMSSAELAARVSDETGTGSLVFGTAPTLTNANLVTPSLGAATATSINGNTIPSNSSVVVLTTVAQTLDLKTLTSPTLTGTPIAPTATTTAATTQVATTAFVHNVVESEIIAKAYCTVDTGTGAVTILKSRNITSITLAGTYYTVVMTNAAADANYTVLSLGGSAVGGFPIAAEFPDGGARTTTTFYIAYYSTVPSPDLDPGFPSIINLVVFA